MTIPFLRPQVVAPDTYRAALEQMQATRLYSNFGPLNTEFERQLRQRLFEATGAVTTVANATLGLMLAIDACRRRTGTIAIMPSFTFAATPLAAQWCGLRPYFLDVSEDDWCMAPEEVAQAVDKLGDRVGVVVACSTFGVGIDLAPYGQLIQSGVPVVVDAAAALGVQRASRPWGVGFEGPIVYSLHATKTFAVGEGGAIYSASLPLIDTIRANSNFGFSSGRSSTHLGLNAKMSEMTAAVALATLEQFPAKCARRRELVKIYQNQLQEQHWFARGWQTQTADESLPRQFFPLAAPPGSDNASLIAAAEQAGVQIRSYFAPACHQQPQFADCPHGDLSYTEMLSRRILSLPLWEEMQPQHIGTVLAVLAEEEDHRYRSKAARSGV